MAKRNWTKEETIIAFNVYCKIPFKSSSKSNPTIIKYANIIDRSPSALNMKIGNLGRFDPELKKQGISGLVNGSKLEEEVWNEFNGNWDKLAFESEELIAKFQNKATGETDLESFPEGKERKTTVRARVNQGFFRSTVLSSYNCECCITGLSIPELLVASHIVPWSIDKNNRTNPHNGLCLNSLHDKAFDKGFLTITPDFQVKLSPIILEKQDMKATKDSFMKFDKKLISLPNRFLPAPEFLDYHFRNIFKS